MSLNVLETDAHGHVVEKPVVGWVVTTGQGITVLTGFEYRDFPPDPNEELRKIQFGLTPQQALQLAQALTDVATDILRKPS